MIWYDQWIEESRKRDNDRRYFRMGRLLCVFVFMYSLALSAKRHFHLQWKRSHRSWNFASDALICPEKAKQELEPLGGLSLSYKTRTKDRIDKGLVYPNVYCSITTTTMKSNLSNTAWHMMKHRLLPDFRILTGQLREHLTETYNQPRAKTGGHGRWLKLVEVGFRFLSLSLFFFPIEQGRWDNIDRNFILIYKFIIFCIH